jgi:hypothetical protein
VINNEVINDVHITLVRVCLIKTRNVFGFANACTRNRGKEATRGKMVVGLSVCEFGKLSNHLAAHGPRIHPYAELLTAASRE